MEATWTTDSLPDSDINVLVRLAGCEEPLAIGYHDGVSWREAGSGARFGHKVDGWIDPNQLADYLDAKTVLARQEELVGL